MDREKVYDLNQLAESGGVRSMDVQGGYCDSINKPILLSFCNRESAFVR